MARNPKSIGEMISTLTFFGVAAACVIQAIEYHEAGLLFRSFVSTLAGLLCLLGGLRFFIADMMKIVKKRVRKWVPQKINKSKPQSAANMWIATGANIYISHMRKIGVTVAENSALRDLIFPQSQYFPQLARNVLILNWKNGFKIISRCQTNPGVENEHGL